MMVSTMYISTARDDVVTIVPRCSLWWQLSTARKVVGMEEENWVWVLKINREGAAVQNNDINHVVQNLSLVCMASGKED